jgi:nucleoside-diphosphate-sugar epimerase
MSLPARFRRTTLLIVGCGDVGLRVLRTLPARVRVLALTSSRVRVGALRDAGAVPLLGDLDDAPSLARLAGLADRVLHLAPPARDGEHDTRTARLLRALARRPRTRRFVYASTSGVYGDCGGARIDETRAIAPATARARRRADAERRARDAALACVLRVPGIYALDRAGGDPRERVSRGTPVLARDDDVHTNHIHADDLARACIAALWRGRPRRVYHASDDDASPMGDWFDRVADRIGLPRPPRLTRADATTQLTPTQMSFLSESRRLDNARLKRELRVRLRYPTIDAAFA